MTGKGSSAKGSAFERLVAKMILERFPQFDAKQCHRTPKSGGHPYESKSDLRFSEELRRLFPYAVECKHHRGFSVAQAWPLPIKQVCDWMLQAETAARAEGGTPLVVMQGNYTPVFCTLPTRERRAQFTCRAVARMAAGDSRLQHHDWTLLLFEDFLATITG